ncbi:MAG: SusD/RagB family nutrient-binding outer membrane lipoprotein [Tannerella sp.]|jgi:hypothetical protein|nr:SusD/RagB family nutrient-binding outer membrane lipoprotein [Tannerella sp.]
MKNKIIYIFSLIGILFFGSCEDFGDINLDPNNPSQADTRFLFVRAMQGTTFGVYSSAPAPSVSLYDPFSQLYPQYFAERQNIQYTEFKIVDFALSTYYNTFLRNLKLIIEMNEDEEQNATEFVGAMGSNDNQIAVARTLEAFYYMHMTDIVGDIYYSEALLGDEGNFTPKFDTQEDIYAALDAKLNDAYSLFDESENLDDTYDILYNGDISKWKKLNASLRMLLAIKLSDIAPEAGKSHFAKAYQDGGILDNGDNLRYQYINETANMNPLHDNVVISGRRDFAPSKTIVDALLLRKDPRVLSYGIPNPSGKFDAVPFGVPRAEISEYAGKTVTFNPKLYEMDAPITIISAARISLVAAEAAVRGWISADAAALYKNGIEMSFQEKDFASDVAGYQNSDPDLWESWETEYGFVLTADDYLAQPQVALTGTTAEKIEKIAMQRWLNGFLEDGIEAWSDWRRLNVPVLDPGRAAEITHVPYRRQYYLIDYETNMDNYKAAIGAQGADNFDTRVWWDVANN